MFIILMNIDCQTSTVEKGNSQNVLDREVLIDSQINYLQLLATTQCSIFKKSIESLSKEKDLEG